MISSKPPPASILDHLVGGQCRLAEAWGRRALRHHVDAGFRDVLSPPALDHWLANDARLPMLRMVRDGDVLRDALFTRSVRIGGRTVLDAANPAAIERLLSEGCTLVLQNLERSFPQVRDLVDRLTAETSHPTQANAYLTPPRAAGLAPHADDHDVLVLQIVGSKRWTVAGLGEIEMVEGDVLYVPRSTLHSAATQDSVSLHLTVGFLATTAAQVVQRVVAGMDCLGEALPLGYATDVAATAAVLRRRLDGVIAHLESLDIDALADAEVERARRRAGSSSSRPLAGLLASADVGPASMVATAGTWSIGDIVDDTIRIAFRGVEISVPAAAQAAIDQLASGEPIRVDSLPGIDPASRVTLAKRLVREGLLATGSCGHLWVNVRPSSPSG